MPSSQFSLNTDEYSVNFLTSHQLETPLRLSFGDHERFTGKAHDAIVKGRNAFVTGADDIQRIIQDESRTGVQKHAMAKEVADRTNTGLEASAAALDGLASAMDAQAKELVDEAFAPDAARSHYELRIVDWIAEKANAGDIPAIRRAVLESGEVAAVLYSAPEFLLGLAGEVRLNVVADGIERHAPKAFKLMDEAQALSAIAIKHRQMTKQVDRTFYTKAIADKIATRFELA